MSNVHSKSVCLVANTKIIRCIFLNSQEAKQIFPRNSTAVSDFETKAILFFTHDFSKRRITNSILRLNMVLLRVASCNTLKVSKNHNAHNSSV